MRICKFLLIVIAGLSGGFLRVAVAADMPIKAPVYKAAPTIVPYSWTGFYIGLNAGYGWSDTDGVIVGQDPATENFLFTMVPPDLPSSFPLSGIFGGGQVGHNWQFSSLVVGFEADIQYSDIDGNSSATHLLNPGFFGNAFTFRLDAERSLKWFATLRGRIGVLLLENLLLYGTGGLVVGESNANVRLSLTAPNALNIGAAGGLTATCSTVGVPPPVTCYSGSDSRTFVSWTGGGGFEYRAWENWSAKFEYLHLAVDDQTVRAVAPSPPSSPGVFFDYRFGRMGIDIVRFGLNRKLNWRH